MNKSNPASASALLGVVLDNLAEGVVVIDERGEVQLWNRAACSILGEPGPLDPRAHWPADLQALAADGLTLLPVDESPLARALRGEAADDVLVCLRGPRHPRGVWVSTNARALCGAGRVVGAVAILRDVTEERSARRAADRALRLASMGALAAGIAHELNGPLGAVLGNLELAARHLAPSGGNGEVDVRQVTEAAACVRDARDAAQRLRDVARDVNRFSRADDEPIGPVDLARVLDASIRFAMNESRRRALLVKEYGELPLVEASEGRLGQVFLNLIVNALHAIPEGNARDHRIRVSARDQGAGFVVVEIADTGSGIPADVLPKIFDPFFTTKPEGVGIGLGLSVSRRIVSELGGRMEVESQLGLGSMFRVILPTIDGRAARPSR